ncbi:hypothetical protein [Halioxenophilus aromaticivorans]|uniref:Uncharacterized protein n=1 Tax=Halioxenophilus aromaticivorans TaxID=1306992 RepID=A0AAV3TZR8_9ALTE
MKVHIELDLTPQEARELMGLDGMDQMQQLFIKSMSGEMTKEGYPFFDMFQNFVKQGQETLERYRKVVETTTTTTGSTKSGNGSEH